MVRKTTLETLIAVILILYMTAGVAYAADSSGVTSLSKGERTVTDMAGRNVVLPEEVNNAMVLFGPGYEKMVILDAEDKISICADFHKTHAAWAHVIYKRLDTVPAMSNPTNPNPEEVLKENPDVIFYFGDNKFTQYMTDLNVPVICSVGGAAKLESLKDQILMFGLTLGEKETELAYEYCDYFDEKLYEILGKTSFIEDNKKPKVYVTSGIPLRTKGGNSVMADTVEKAGGIYVAKELNATSTINPEQLITWNPDIIIVDHAPDLPDPSSSATSNTPDAFAIQKDILSDPAFQGINAVKNKQVYISPIGAFFWDAGQQGILQLEWMAQIFHPDIFSDVNMKKELKEFYSKFFRYDLTNEEIDLIMNHELPPNAAEFGYEQY